MVVPNKHRKQALSQKLSAHSFSDIMRRAKNLYLDPDAIEHGEKYSRIHKTNLSQLVSDFLRSLPLEADVEYTPAVKRLIGAASSKKRIKRPVDVHDYHDHLMKKYGGNK